MADNDLVKEKQFVEFAVRVDERLDVLELGTPKAQALTLAADVWTNDGGDTNYPYQYRLAVLGVTTASRADAVLDAASVVVARACGVCPVSDTAADTVIFLSRKAPAADLTGTLYITQTTR